MAPKKKRKGISMPQQVCILIVFVVFISSWILLKFAPDWTMGLFRQYPIPGMLIIAILGIASLFIGIGGRGAYYGRGGCGRSCGSSCGSSCGGGCGGGD